MKRLIVLSQLFLLAQIVTAQSAISFTEGQSALVYSLPKTEFCIEITVEKTTEKPGMFFRYSERYLATNKVIIENKTTYKFINILVKTQAVADSNRTYTVVPVKNSATSHLSVNKNGILCGIRQVCEQENENNISTNNPSVNDNESANLLPLGEEYMMAGSEAKLAEGAAKQIYRIRESRLGILTADVEKLPADGASFKSMMDGLNKMESELTELFIGKTTKEIQTQRVYLTPTTALNNEVLFRLSAFNGVVSTTDLSGVPYFISILPTTIPVVAANPNTKTEIPALYYIHPASSLITIGDGLNTLYSNKFDIPQLGTVIPLSENFLKQPKIKVKIDTQTGRLLSVE